MQVTRTLLSAGVFCLAAFGQSAPARPEFEVASVKPSTAHAGPNQVNIGVKINGAQVHISALSLQDYIRIAYRLKAHQVTGPEWMAGERFEIDAKLPSGGTREQVPDMLQAL